MKLACLAFLLLCPAFASAQEEPRYEPSANAAAIIVVPSAEEVEREWQAARALAERRQEMIDDCEQNHGSEIDCKRETDTELRAERLPWRTRVAPFSPIR
jgi:hypothetical protein